MEFNSNNIRNELETHKNSFEIFQIKYTDDEKICINDFNIKNDIDYQQYSHFGNIKTMKNFKEFISNIGKNKRSNIKKLIKIIKKKLINIVLQGYDMKYFWISIRITLPNKLYIIPRWHQDGKYFNTCDNTQNLQSKFVTILKGDGTLFVTSNETSLNIISDNLNKMRKYISDNNIVDFNEQLKINDEIFRPKLAERIEECKINKDCKITQLNNDEGVIFYVGDKQKAAIHSEPMMSQPRIFISILPGTKEEINELGIRFAPKKQYGGNNNKINLMRIYKKSKLHYTMLKDIN